jgi:hypothetical protein
MIVTEDLIYVELDFNGQDIKPIETSHVLRIIYTSNRVVSVQYWDDTTRTICRVTEKNSPLHDIWQKVRQTIRNTASKKTRDAILFTDNIRAFQGAANEDNR